MIQCQVYWQGNYLLPPNVDVPVVEALSVTTDSIRMQQKIGRHLDPNQCRPVLKFSCSLAELPRLRLALHAEEYYSIKRASFVNNGELVQEMHRSASTLPLPLLLPQCKEGGHYAIHVVHKNQILSTHFEEVEEHSL